MVVRNQKKSKFPPGKVALERALSKLGIASRSQARKWIIQGRLQVNRIVQKNPEYLVTPEKAEFALDGQPVGQVEAMMLLLNKPKGIITSRSDEKGRPTVFSLISEVSTHLSAVGRLDFATSGLLLLTNDTRLAAWLTDPDNEIIRTYLVTVRGPVKEEELLMLKNGIRDKDQLLQVNNVILRKLSQKESHLTVELTEGKNREIRRIFQAIGHEVTKLKRVAFGGLTLGTLAVGEYRVISLEELKAAFPQAPIRSRLKI
ncbi:MAG: rRNA pseudouridine synthase [Bdellovibrio sp.]|nr:rRNA pseudouridine synthase [Bdellovibrio sp.]